MDVVERELGVDSSGPFFLGQDVTLVDCVFAPFLERIVASIAYYKGMAFQQLYSRQREKLSAHWLAASILCVQSLHLQPCCELSPFSDSWRIAYEGLTSIVACIA